MSKDAAWEAETNDRFGVSLAKDILPVMPATPFLLLSGYCYCYARGSDRCHIPRTRRSQDPAV
jgi:hypothetical protein